MSLIDPGRLSAATDDDIAYALSLLQAESAMRAIERADVPALLEEAFTSGFDAKGMPRDPYLRSGILVCMGGKVDRSAMAHVCGFVRVNDTWVWEADGVLEDSVRYLPGPRTSMRTVTLVPAPHGTTVDLVCAKTKMGVHEMTSVRSFSVEGDSLDLVSARSVKAVSHRPGA